MCCLFGVYNYSGKENKEICDLINNLGLEATTRGTDASGIAYNTNNHMVIYKRPLPAYEMTFKNVENVRCVTGHTRHATQGDKKKNQNNHPFLGFAENGCFSLSHNGVLFNDFELRKKYNFKKSSIETDSYIAVQLLENYGKLNVKNIGKMAEEIEGSFAFSILDSKDNLYLVKGDSPLSLIHLPEQKIYIYASTSDILYKGIVPTVFFDEVKSGKLEEIKVKAGDILTITPDGSIIRDTFNYSYYTRYYGRNWWDYGTCAGDSTIYPVETADTKTTTSTYLKEVKQLAKYYGYEPEEIDGLLADGFTLDEITDMFY